MGPRLKIAFVTDGEPFHGASPEERALGGSETALVQMARALAARGHQVQVFCACPRPGVYQGVTYWDNQSIPQKILTERLDVLMVSRFMVFLDFPWQAGLRVLWNHDILDRPSELKKRLPLVDMLLVLSAFQARDYALRLPECGPKLFVTKNGLDLPLLEKAALGAEPDPWRMTYVSRPERGLELLLEQIWPRLKNEFPRLSLELCGYQVTDTPLHPHLQAQYEHIALLESQAGVIRLGALAKKDYYRHLACCGALLYPCTFPEISCIAALEAQALGVPVLTSDSFALKETVVTPEFKVSGHPGSRQYVDNFVALTRQALTNPEQTRRRALAARGQIVRDYDWSVIARQWEELFAAYLNDRLQHRPEALAAGLLIQGDALAAAEVMGKAPALPRQETVPLDPLENQLLKEMGEMLAPRLTSQARVGLLAPHEGLKALTHFLPPGVRLVELRQEPGRPPASQDDLEAVIVRDCLERQEDPTALLAWLQALAPRHSYLLLCCASGAWPLLSAGFGARTYDFDLDGLSFLLSPALISHKYLPRGLVGSGAERYHVGRLLALSTFNYELKPLLPLNCASRARPVPEFLLTEVMRAGLF